jgi:hypothetical protein
VLRLAKRLRKVCILYGSCRRPCVLKFLHGTADAGNATIAVICIND